MAFAGRVDRLIGGDLKALIPVYVRRRLVWEKNEGG
jgi:hypothetical protein